MTNSNIDQRFSELLKSRGLVHASAGFENQVMKQIGLLQGKKELVNKQWKILFTIIYCLLITLTIALSFFFEPSAIFSDQFQYNLSISSKVINIILILLPAFWLLIWMSRWVEGSQKASFQLDP